MPQNVSDASTELLERVLFVASKKHLQPAETELQYLKDILEENLISDNMSELHQHGLVVHLIESMHAIDITVPYIAETTGQRYSTILEAIYRFLIDSCMIARVKAKLQSSMTSSFDYETLFKTVELQFPSECDVFGVWRTSMVALVQSPELPTITGAIELLRDNPIHTHEKIINILHILGHLPNLYRYKDLMLNAFQAYCTAETAGHPLTSQNLLEPLAPMNLTVELLVATEVNPKLQDGLNLLKRYPPSRIHIDEMISFLNKAGRTNNLYNKMCIDEGNNEQCLVLFGQKLKDEVGDDAHGYQKQFKGKGLIILFSEAQQEFNLSDDYLAMPIPNSPNLLRQIVSRLGWKITSGSWNLKALRNDFEKREQLCEQKLIEQQKQIEKDERLKLAAQKKANAIAELLTCIKCKQTTSLEEEQVCKDCLQKGFQCSICQTLLESIPEIKATMCISCIEVDRLDEIEQQKAAQLALEEAQKRQCFMCKQMKSPSEIAPAPALHCHACLTSLSTTNTLGRFANPNPHRLCGLCGQNKTPAEMGDSEIVCKTCKS